jgi:uncharacterized delta-60 repeat protein
LDTTFDPDANNTVYLLVVQADGKILMGGDFTAVGGVTRNGIARLNADGSLDATFNPDADDDVLSLAVQADGKILMGGYFTTVGDVARNGIARLNADGSLDATFNPDANDYVLSLAVQADGKILMGGDFNKGIARLNADGSLDATFNSDASASANKKVLSLVVQADGKILMGGGFTIVGGVARSYIARLSADAAALQSVDIASSGRTATWLRSGSGPELSRTTMEVSTDSITWTTLTQGQRVNGGWKFEGLTITPETLMTLRFRGYHSSGMYSGSGSGLIETIKQVYLAKETSDLCFPVKASIGNVVVICL